MADVPDSTAVRVALWRALHGEVDGEPHVLDDRVGLDLIAPAATWRDRPDMHPLGTAGSAPRSSPGPASSTTSSLSSSPPG